MMLYYFNEILIENRRKEMRLTKTELCKKAGIGRKTYYKLISGLNITLPRALAVMQELHITFPEAIKTIK